MGNEGDHRSQPTIYGNISSVRMAIPQKQNLRQLFVLLIPHESPCKPNPHPSTAKWITKGINLRRMHSTLFAQAYRLLVNYPSKISELQKIYQIRDLTQHTKWCNFSLVPFLGLSSFSLMFCFQSLVKESITRAGCQLPCISIRRHQNP
jgi:hypothetical protein